MEPPEVSMHMQIGGCAWRGGFFLNNGLMPLMNSSFEPGACLKCVQALPGEVRVIGQAEYSYFTCQPLLACSQVEGLLGSDDIALQLSANMISGFASLALGRIAAAQSRYLTIERDVTLAMQADSGDSARAAAMLIAKGSSTLLHLPERYPFDVLECLNHLDGGMRLFACYVLAHEAYLSGEYGRSLGIADTAAALSDKTYPIPMIYLELIAAGDLMSLMRPAEARARFMSAWDMASLDGLIEPFAEHHGLCQGLVEACLKHDHNEDYRCIVETTHRFRSGWCHVHNLAADEDVADNLTTTEFAVAMLASRGWPNKDIANHMGVTVRTVKQHLSDVYDKLGISHRSELGKFMLR